MKTLHVINSLGAGGAERSLAELVARLPSEGIVPTVVCLKRQREGFERDVTEAGIETRFIEAASPAASVVALQRVIRELRPHIVHTTLFDSDQIGRVASIGIAPTLTSLVNTSYGRVRQSLPGIRPSRLWAAWMVDATTARLAAHFHAISNAVKAAAVEELRLRPEAITVIPRGRDLARLGTNSRRRRLAARASLGLDPGSPVILNVARQEYQKGQVHLLEAAAQLRRSQPDAVWLVAGRLGNATASLQRRFQELALDGTGTVRFLGHRDDIPDLLAASDIFVFPSLYEGLGGAVLEAMAMEIPVVASDLPALREVLDEGRAGVLVPPGDADSIVGAIGELLDSSERVEHLIEAAGDRFHEHYRLEPVVHQMAALFREVAG